MEYIVKISEDYASLEQKLFIARRHQDGRMEVAKIRWVKHTPGMFCEPTLTIPMGGAGGQSSDETQLLRGLADAMASKGIWPQGFDRTAELEAVRDHKDHLGALLDHFLAKDRAV